MAGILETLLLNGSAITYAGDQYRKDNPVAGVAGAKVTTAVADATSKTDDLRSLMERFNLTTITQTASGLLDVFAKYQALTQPQSGISVPQQYTAGIKPEALGIDVSATGDELTQRLWEALGIQPQITLTSATGQQSSNTIILVAGVLLLAIAMLAKSR